MSLAFSPLCTRSEIYGYHNTQVMVSGRHSFAREIIDLYRTISQPAKLLCSKILLLIFTHNFDEVLVVLCCVELQYLIAGRKAPLTFVPHRLNVSVADGGHRVEILTQPALVLQNLLLSRVKAYYPVKACSIKS